MSGTTIARFWCVGHSYVHVAQIGPDGKQQPEARQRQRLFCVIAKLIELSLIGSAMRHSEAVRDRTKQHARAVSFNTLEVR